MIIHPKFLSAHIPKTGGHAQAVMWSQIPRIKFKSPFRIEKGIAQSTNAYKHTTFYQYAKKHPEHLYERELVLTLRRLPEWLISYLWHQSLSTRYNEKNKTVYKVGVRQAYSKEHKKQPGLIYFPKIACHMVIADHILSEFLKGIPSDKVLHWFRMEKLGKDLIAFYKKAFKTDISAKIRNQILSVGHYHSYDHPIANRYWTPETLKILYANNPLWAQTEEMIYGDLFTVESK